MSKSGKLETPRMIIDRYYNMRRLQRGMPLMISLMALHDAALLRLLSRAKLESQNTIAWAACFMVRDPKPNI